MSTNEKQTIQQQYANRPNLRRVACELSTCKNPYKAADILLEILASRREDDAAV